jgi:hypothetical protein
VNDAGRSVEQEAASVQNSVNTSLAQAEADAAATRAVENSIAPPAPALTAEDEVQALEKCIAEQALETKPVISVDQMAATLQPAAAASPASPMPPVVDATKKVA